MAKYDTILSTLNQWLMFIDDDLIIEIDNMFILNDDLGTDPTIKVAEKVKTSDVRFSNIIKQIIESIWDDLGQILDRTRVNIKKREWDEYEEYISSHIGHLINRYIKKRETFAEDHNMQITMFYIKEGLSFGVDNFRIRLKKRISYRRSLAQTLYQIGNHSINKSSYVITFVALIISLFSLVISLITIL